MIQFNAQPIYRRDGYTSDCGEHFECTEDKWLHELTCLDCRAYHCILSCTARGKAREDAAATWVAEEVRRSNS